MLDPGAWIFGIALFACAYMAWTIGANDVANAMGTSVGSHAITLGQALAVAAVFEFAGAFLVGGHVTDTIRKGILVEARFAGDPDLFVVGMLSALLASAAWVTLATWKGMPVSTTHAIVGSVTGFGVLIGGVGAVQWGQIGSIVLSWVVSPLAGGILAYLTFLFIKRNILIAWNPARAARRVVPFLVFPVLFVLVLSVIYKGLQNLSLNLPLGKAVLIAAGAGLAGTIIAAVLLARLPKARLRRRRAFEQVEGIFKWLQLLTACYVAFSHGANDVANAIGPFAGIVAVHQSGNLDLNLPVPLWVLALGGLGIVLGLATWGYKVIMTLGTRITRITPTRGFSAEFATATTVLACSKLGLPISTSHTIVGAVVGVGMARGIEAINTRVLGNIVTSWVVTIPVSALLTVAVFFLLKGVLGLC